MENKKEVSKIYNEILGFRLSANALFKVGRAKKILTIKNERDFTNKFYGRKGKNGTQCSFTPNQLLELFRLLDCLVIQFEKAKLQILFKLEEDITDNGELPKRSKKKTQIMKFG